MKQVLFLILATGCLSVSAQNVGIGLNAVTRGKLEVDGVAFPGSATMALFGSENNGVSFQRNWPTIGFNQYRDDVVPGSQGKYMANGYAAIQYFDYNSGSYAFDMFPSGNANASTPGGVRAITIANNGNTGIRTDYTNATLVVARGDAANVDGSVVFAGTTHWSHFNYYTNEDTYIRSGKDGGTVYINKIPNGKVLAGTTSSHIGINNHNPFYTIEVWQPNGAKAFTMVDAYNYRWSMAVNWINTLNNGMGMVLDLYYNNVGKSRFRYWDGALVVLSDERLKKEIEPMDPVLEKLKKLKTVRYEMARNNPRHEQSIGMIAQDVKPLFPLMVHQVTDHNRNGQPINDAHVMDYSSFGVIAIKALQEQEKEIIALQAQKQQLISQLEQLEKRLSGN
ncbi:MAG: tail fiber domain-containing protein [Bacteroidota bacterium]